MVKQAERSSGLGPTGKALSRGLVGSIGAKYRWLVWGALSLVAFNQLIQMFAYSVLIPSLLEELDLSYALAGTLASAYMLSLSAVMIPVGVLGDRLGGRNLVLAGVLAMSLGAAVFAMADSYLLALASRVLVGAGAAVALVLPPPMLAYWFAKDQYRVVVGLHVSLGKMGSVVAMWVLPPLVLWLGWRAGYGVISLVGPLTLLIAALFVVDRPGSVGLKIPTLAVQGEESSPSPRPPRGMPLRELLRNRDLVLMAASQFFVFANYFGMTNWLPTYFKSAVGLTEVEAGFQTGFILWGTIVGYAFSGVIVNRIGRCAPLFAAGAALAAALTVVFATGGLSTLPGLLLPPLMLVYGLSVSIMVLSLPILVSFVPTPSLATASGIVLTLGYLGAMVSPPLIGAVADTTGSLVMAFWVAAGSAAIACFTALLIRETGTAPSN